MDEMDFVKVASVNHHGLYWNTRMPFGVENAPATFPSAMNVMLPTVEWQYATVYINEVII